MAIRAGRSFQNKESLYGFANTRRGASIDPHGEACLWAGRRPDPRDAGKKINGKKRHILVDTLGLLLDAIVHPADIQDRDGGVLVLSALFGMYPFPQKLLADGGYQGPVFQKALAKALPHLKIEIVKRSDQAKGFEVLPKRWVVERTFACSAFATPSNFI
jgi:transposase